MLMAPSSPQLASLRPSGLTLSDWTAPWCASCTRTHSPLCTSHQRMLPSLPPLSSTAAVGLQVSAYTIALGSLQACRRCPLDISQTKSSPLPPLPLPPLASRVPSGLQATLMTTPRCPWNRCSRVPSEARHRHTLPSSPPLANRVPSGLHATRRILVGCERPTHRRVPVVTSHTCTPC